MALDEAVGELPLAGNKPGSLRAPDAAWKPGGATWGGHVGGPSRAYADPGGPSRFFYCAKASRRERTMGGRVENRHPTVKPLALMRYLVRLATPPGGLVLDPFAGSGTTLLAALAEGFDALGFEQDAENAATAAARVECALADAA